MVLLVDVAVLLVLVVVNVLEVDCPPPAPAEMPRSVELPPMTVAPTPTVVLPTPAPTLMHKTPTQGVVEVVVLEEELVAVVVALPPIPIDMLTIGVFEELNAAVVVVR